MRAAPPRGTFHAHGAIVAELQSAIRCVAAVLAIVGLVVATSIPSLGHHDGVPAAYTSTDCPHGGNYVAAACLLGVTHDGVQTEWNNRSMWVEPSYLQADRVHVNHGIWTYSGVACDSWVEIGLTYGFRGSAVYGYYYAKSDESGLYADFLYATAEIDQSIHKYALVYAGPGSVGATYAILLDDIEVNRFDNMGFGSCRSSAGLEIPQVLDDSLRRIAPDSRTSSATFDLINLKYRGLNGWVDGWTQHYMVQWPCGSAPRCMNGVFYSATHWSDNKP